MRPLKLCLSWITLALGAASCGGSSSETPFPEEPLPEYLLNRRGAEGGAPARKKVTEDQAEKKPRTGAPAASVAPADDAKVPPADEESDAPLF